MVGFCEHGYEPRG